MFDGINLAYHECGTNSRIHRLDYWEILINERTGKPVNECKSASIEGLNLLLKPSTKGGNSLTVKGSLHKFYNNGLQNSDQFTFSKLNSAVLKLENKIGISASKLELHGLEIGVNIELPVKASSVIKNAVCFKGNPFTFINKKEPLKGIVCSLSDYELKIYDKGKQANTGAENLLRIEIKVNKMRHLRELSLKYLTDLTDLERTYNAVYVINEALSNVIWTDTKIDLSKMNDREQKQFLYYSNPKTWQNINKHKAYRGRNSFKTLLKKYSNTDTLFILQSRVETTWKALFESLKEAEKPRPFHRVSALKEAQKNATFSPFIWTVNKSHNTPSKARLKNLKIFRPETHLSIKSKTPKKNEAINSEPRKCISCGNDISRQRKGSKFCSEKFTSKKHAKQCRNKSSNNTRKIKRLIDRESEKGNVFTIHFTNGKSKKIIKKPKAKPPNSWYRNILRVIVDSKECEDETPL